MHWTRIWGLCLWSQSNMLIGSPRAGVHQKHVLLGQRRIRLFWFPSKTPIAGLVFCQFGERTVLDMSRGVPSLIQVVMWCRTILWHCRLSRGAGPLIDSFCMLVIDHCMSRVVGTQCDMLFFHSLQVHRWHPHPLLHGVGPAQCLLLVFCSGGALAIAN